MGKIEIASFNVESARIAQANGADRVELCAEMNVGGTTPAIDDVVKVREAITIDLNVMVRPRGGDFIYTVAEFEQMKNEIITLKAKGVDGFVFGILKEGDTVDIDRNTELVKLASPLPCTYHRAFDRLVDMKQGLEDVIACGFHTILTSGCISNVNDDLMMLKQLVEWSANRIVIMLGGGLRSTNVIQILEATDAVYFHSSAITDGGDTAVAEEVAALVANVKV